MNIFKTKYQLLPSTIDEMQYIKRDNSESSYKDQNLLFKNPNYTASHIKAVSGSKYLAIKANRLSGKNVNTEKKIYKKNEPDNKTSSIFGELHNIRHRRLFKKNGIIYDLIK
mgnify:CR=1 FL=1